MIVRHRLPNRRASTIFEFDAAGLRFVATVSRSDDDNPAEIFIGSNEADSAAGVVASDATPF
jgi:hypothetical protein